MYFDRWDIVEAHFLYCRDHHGGQWSKLYLRGCNISRYFRVQHMNQRTSGHGLNYENLSDNGKAIYDTLVAERRHQND